MQMPKHSDEAKAAWFGRGLEHVATLPPKAAKKSAAKKATTRRTTAEKA